MTPKEIWIAIAAIALVLLFFSGQYSTTPSNSETVAQNTSRAIKTIYTNATANIRSCAASDCKIIGTLAQNTSFAISAGQYSNITDISQLPDWFYVNYQSTPGGPYDSSGYISKSTLSDHETQAADSNSTGFSQTISTPTPRNLDLPSIIEEWRKSTAYVECYWDYANSSRWFQRESGSGLLALLDSKPTLITNKHVVYDPRYGVAQECDFGFPDNQSIYFSITTFDQPAQQIGQIFIPAIPSHGQIKFTADGTDVAYLSDFRDENSYKNLGITAPISIYERAQSGRFVCSTEADIGEPLVILGYPSYGSGAGTFVSIFSNLDITATEGIIAGKDAGYYTTSAKIEHGNSGGLAIDEKNDCYLGIPTASYTGQIESLGRILPASYVVK